MSAPLLEAHGLACGYDERVVLAGAELAVRPGELVGVVGPNGAGKSTLVKTLAGLVPAKAGRVLVAGKPLSGYGAAALARERAYLPQELPADEGWRVREIVHMGRFPYQRGWGLVERAADREAVARALAATQLEDLADSRVERLSGGQRQRVYLARALAQEAPLLVLDEPTAHLDLGHELEFFRLLRAGLARGRRAAVAVLHDLNLAAQFCQRLWVVGAGDALVPGAILADGPPEAVLVPELIERAFGLAVQVRHHPETGLPYLLPRVARHTGALAEQGRLHVIAGGGAGERLIPTLHRLGYELSVGAVNLLDSDQAIAERLGLATVVEAPFSPLGAATLAQLATTMADAPVVVVGDVAWGSGNIGNLRALAALATGATIWLVEETPLAARDFTGGEASRIVQDLVARGARTIGLDALLERLRDGGRQA